MLKVLKYVIFTSLSTSFYLEINNEYKNKNKLESVRKKKKMHTFPAVTKPAEVNPPSQYRLGLLKNNKKFSVCQASGVFLSILVQRCYTPTLLVKIKI